MSFLSDVIQFTLDPFDLGVADALKRIVRTPYGQVLSGRVAINTIGREQRDDAFDWTDFVGSPATEGTWAEPYAEAAAVAFGAAAAAGALAGAAGSAGAEAGAVAADVTAEAAVVSAAEVVEEAPVLDWISNTWDAVTEWWSGTPDVGIADTFDAEAAFGGSGAELGSLVAGELSVPDISFPEVGQLSDWARIGSVGGQIFSDTPGVPVQRMPGVVPAMGTVWRGAGVIGRGLGSAAAATGGAMAGMTLATVFGAARGGARFLLNGISGTIPQLWKYTRRFGPHAVAAALGIGVGQLGELLLANPEQPRRRRRGISARDIRTTKRVVNFVSRMASQIGCVRAPRHFRRRK